MNKITKLSTGVIDCHEVYLDWVNNYLTLDNMASDYGFIHEFLESCIENGRSINQLTKTNHNQNYDTRTEK